MEEVKIRDHYLRVGQNKVLQKKLEEQKRAKIIAQKVGILVAEYSLIGFKVKIQNKPIKIKW